MKEQIETIRQILVEDCDKGLRHFSCIQLWCRKTAEHIVEALERDKPKNGSITATCGHEIPDVSDKYCVEIYSQDRMGNPCVDSIVACEKCIAEYAGADLLVKPEREFPVYTLDDEDPKTVFRYDSETLCTEIGNGWTDRDSPAMPCISLTKTLEMFDTFNERIITEAEARAIMEPKVVPWTLDTLPKDRPVWIQMKHKRLLLQIVSATDCGVRYLNANEDDHPVILFLSWQRILDEWEQLDGSPCGERSEPCIEE